MRTRTHTKETPSRCRAVIHLEIPGDESYTELGSSEDSFSSVFNEHFSLTKSESICPLWEISPPAALEWGFLVGSSGFSEEARNKDESLQGPEIPLNSTQKGRPE